MLHQPLLCGSRAATTAHSTLFASSVSAAINVSRTSFAGNSFSGHFGLKLNKQASGSKSNSSRGVFNEARNIGKLMTSSVHGARATEGVTEVRVICVITFGTAFIDCRLYNSISLSLSLSDAGRNLPSNLEQTIMENLSRPDISIGCIRS
ncbi:Isoamylase 3, chloroplastic [Stylosanthes scabra]|uniref:Isoamylase 3, chloroplastic n=1 Tax=Stylosanthes scabra TaxID=79078 RepID=A0ABU6U2R2_9FABA|nr:Isoamylase 3, chloroplastic [Stylosanthes scabra]